MIFDEGALVKCYNWTDGFSIGLIYQIKRIVDHSAYERDTNGELIYFPVYTILNDAGEEKPFRIPSEYFVKVEA